MMIRFAIIPLLLALNFSMCTKHPTPVTSAEPVTPSPTPAGAGGSPGPGVAGAPPPSKITKAVVDQTAQTIIFCYHRLVDKVRYPGTEITPADFEAQMKLLKDSGITVISMQDLLAWKRGEKNIPPRCAVITFDDGWKSQYEVAWPIMKKFGYPFTMFLYTEGVRGGSLGGGEAITWEQLADMRDNGVDIEAHSATHQDLREGHNIMLAAPGGKKTRTKLTGPEYEKWVQNEVVGSKELLEQRLGIKANCFAVPFGNYNEHVKQLARNAGFEAMFTVYGQPITFTSPLDSLGRYAIEANKSKRTGLSESMWLPPHRFPRRQNQRRRRRNSLVMMIRGAHAPRVLIAAPSPRFPFQEKLRDRGGAITSTRGRVRSPEFGAD